MSSELTHGIENRGEFYSHHYLDALLEGDLKPLLGRWAEGEQATPPRRSPPRVLNGLAGTYFQSRADASDVGGHAPEVALAVAHGLHAHLLEALGYERKAVAVPLEDGTTLPLVHEVRRSGSSYLWVLEAAFPADGDGDPLDHKPLRTQLPPDARDAELPDLSWRDLLDSRIFREEDAPTWVLFLGGSEVVLTHAFKWPRGQAIAFDLDALYARRQATAFRAMAGLLHADALCPAEGTPLHEQLDENSHKHAFAVSNDLREGAQEAIELLGNEAIRFLREERKKGVFGGSDSAEDVDERQLTLECLRWLYRLIFLFYVESRSDEMGVAPMRSAAYRRGYSLESLRDLELVPLTTPQAQEGSYIDASLRRLFGLLNDGHPIDSQLALLAGADTVAFRIHGLKSKLFDDAETPILAKVRFRNSVLQKVIELLSLSKEAPCRAGRRRPEDGRGRISYASLGINQLGAVYEGLLSYTGFFAKEDLIEVANAKENGKDDARTFFVPARDRELYEDDELVRDETGARRQYPRGTYLFRLAGRDREKSASYYTPEVLTRCLVKYTLRERIGTDPADANWVAADGLLELTLCEPAMGSGAFLNEVVNQLAEAYLQRKQAELRAADPAHEGIPADRYLRELQRVKGRIAANQCYGVDLNPLAAELGKVSLWLNVLRAGAPAPFLDARIATGNSLVGARRATYSSAVLKKSSKKTGSGWLDLPPDPIEGRRAQGAVYHFLLPAAGMAAFDQDKVVGGLLPGEVARIKDWRKKLNASWTPMEKLRLETLSGAVDRLWAEHAAHRAAALAECDQRAPVWPEPEPPASTRTDEEHLRGAWQAHDVRNLAGRRLKRAMDYWSALWFWPVRQADLLPTRKEWLDDLEQVLVAKPRPDLDGAEDRQAKRLQLVPEIADRRSFFHWEWAFPEVFDRGGFDVMVGNPPWLRVEFKESGVLSDLDPRLEIRRQSAKAVAGLRNAVLADNGPLDTYLGEFVEVTGAREFTGDDTLYAALQGTKANLYKTFIVRASMLAGARGVYGFIHPDGVFDDPKGTLLRRLIYTRLTHHFQFLNYLRLFDGVLHKLSYSICVYGPSRAVAFTHVSNLVHPRTLDESLAHDGSGEVPGIKTLDGTWDLRGHASRIVEVDEEVLGLFASLYDSPETPPLEARLPVVHSSGILTVLTRLATANDTPTTGGVAAQFHAEHFNETRRQADGTINKETVTPRRTDELVIQGPHIYVASPLNKTPNDGCKHNQDYSVVPLGQIPADYLPRSNFRCGDRGLFTAHTPAGELGSAVDLWRVAYRAQLAPAGERTLVAAIIPRGVAHVHSVSSFAVGRSDRLAETAAYLASLVLDFLVKTTGKASLYRADIERTPMNLASGTRPHLRSRSLRLNCLTNHYADLWLELYGPGFRADTHTKPDPRLPDWTHLRPEWTWDTPLRTPFARRQALVELDALAALALGLTADELALIYRIQFPVLQGYEADTWYDRRGRIVFTNNRGLTGVGLDRKQWEELRGDQLDPMTYAGVAPLPDWAHDALGPYEPPFDRCDREADMRQAYAEFVRRGVGSEP